MKPGDLSIDCHKLNVKTEFAQYPMPRIEYILHGVKKKNFMSTLDLSSGYHQIPITKVHMHKTSFMMPFETHNN